MAYGYLLPLKKTRLGWVQDQAEKFYITHSTPPLFLGLLTSRPRLPITRTLCIHVHSWLFMGGSAVQQTNSLMN